MDCEFESWLSEAGLLHLADVFKANGFNCSALLLANEEHLREMVPLVGERIRLIDLLSKKRVSNIYSVASSSPPLTDHLILPNNQKLIVVDDQCNEVFNGASQVGIFDVVNTNENVATENEESSKELPSNTNTVMDDNYRSVGVHESVFFQEQKSVKDFLIHNSFGNAIMKFHTIKGKLDADDRKKLVHVLVDGLLNRHKTIDSQILSSLANYIVKIFPGEKCEMYHFERNNGKRMIRGGKLTDRYRNQKKFISSRGGTNEADPPRIKPPVQNLDKIEWLRTSTSPTNKVIQYWNDTRETRFAERLSSDPAYKMVENWPILKNEMGFRLINLDFMSIYPTKDKLSIKWNSVRQVLLKILDEDRRTSNFKSIKFDNEELQDICTIQALACILPAAAHHYNKKIWKPTVAEIAVSFLDEVSSVGELVEKIESRKKKYSSFGLTFQPAIFKLKDSDDQYYVSFDDIQYRVSSFLEAIDVAFKTIQVLNLQYSMESRNIWTFIQTYIYEINTIYDVKSPSITDLIGRLERAN